MFRFSIPVRILLLAGITYIVVLLLTTTITLVFKIDTTTLWLGLSIGKIFLLLQWIAVIFVTAIASYFYFDRPLFRLVQAMNKAGEGDLLIRASQTNDSEIGILADNFNQMLEKLTHLSTHKVQSEHDLVVAKEELKYKKRLEETSLLIHETNRKLENLVADLSVIYDIGQGINQTIELQQLYQLISEVLQKHLKLENFSLMVWDAKSQTLQVKAAFGFEDPSILEMSFQGGEGIAGSVLSHGKVICVADCQKDPRFQKRHLPMEGSLLSAPLQYKGEMLGVVNFGRDKRGAFNIHDEKMLTLVANQVALAMANAKLYTKTRELSVKDELTGVYNRRHFNQVLQLEWKRAVRFKRELSLLMVDVDFFKRFNDTYGHLEGDKVLRQLGDLLGINLREVDTIARFGGEEFVVLLPDTDKRGALAVAEKLRHLVQEQVRAITVSVGVANFPDDVMEMDDLIDDADIALYEAKDKGRNQVVTYRPQRKSDLLQQSQEESEEATIKDRIIH